MLWLITGGIGCGKSEFAADLALSLGREAIRLSCPSFPNYSALEQREEEDHANFSWTHSDADEALANKLNAINLESNIFRADRRVIVIDSLSGWLRGLFLRIHTETPESEAQIEAEWQEVLKSILCYHGQMVVITEDIAAGLSTSSRELAFMYKLAAANRLLLKASHTIYRMTAGMATEVKGYRLIRGK
jgi:adenosylcobinamide kinase/adenosylcobinamide-phosphate guanylyltransferase